MRGDRHQTYLVSKQLQPTGRTYFVLGLANVNLNACVLQEKVTSGTTSTRLVLTGILGGHQPSHQRDNLNESKGKTKFSEIYDYHYMDIIWGISIF